MSWLSSLKSVFAPAQEVKEEEIQKVLQNYVLPASQNALKERISQVNVQGQILQLTINTYPEEKQYLQQIHDELADALEQCGIKELNLHVVQQKTGAKKEGGCGHHHAEGEGHGQAAHPGQQVAQPRGFVGVQAPYRHHAVAGAGGVDDQRRQVGLAFQWPATQVDVLHPRARDPCLGEPQAPALQAEADTARSEAIYARAERETAPWIARASALNDERVARYRRRAQRWRRAAMSVGLVGACVVVWMMARTA